MKQAKAAIDQFFEQQLDELFRSNLPGGGYLGPNPEPGEDDIHQRTMDQAYANYQQKAGRQEVGRAFDGRGKQRSHRNFLDALSEPEQLAVVFGNLNYQVENGGFTQWVDNGYYVDTVDRLKEYCAKYKAQYPVMGRVENLIEELEDFAHQFGEDMDLEELFSHRWEQDIDDAFSSEDWGKLDELVGGTDIDRRRVERATEDALNDLIELSVVPANEVEGDDVPPNLMPSPTGQAQPTGPEQFRWVLKRSRHHGPDIQIEASPTTFPDEDTAYDAGNARAEELKQEETDNEGELYEIAKEEALDYLSKDLKDGVERDMRRVLGRLDHEFYEMNREMLDAVSSILRTEFNVPSPLTTFFQQSMAKARHLMTRMKTSLQHGVSRGLSRAADVLGKAAERSKPAPRPPTEEESVTVSAINRLLN